MSFTKIFLTCNSFARSQNNKADTKHPQYLSMILVFLCVMTISRRASRGCKSEKMKCYEKNCTSFESFIVFDSILKLILDFLIDFLGKPWRSQRGSQKGEQKGGAIALSFALFSIKKVLLLLSIKWNHFWKKGFFHKHHGGKFYVCRKAVFSYNWVLLIYFS